MDRILIQRVFKPAAHAVFDVHTVGKPYHVPKLATLSSGHAIRSYSTISSRALKRSAVTVSKRPSPKAAALSSGHSTIRPYITSSTLALKQLAVLAATHSSPANIDAAAGPINGRIWVLYGKLPSFRFQALKNEVETFISERAPGGTLPFEIATLDLDLHQVTYAEIRQQFEKHLPILSPSFRGLVSMTASNDRNDGLGPGRTVLLAIVPGAVQEAVTTKIQEFLCDVGWAEREWDQTSPGPPEMSAVMAEKHSSPQDDIALTHLTLWTVHPSSSCSMDREIEREVKGILREEMDAAVTESYDPFLYITVPSEQRASHSVMDKLVDRLGQLDDILALEAHGTGSSVDSIYRPFDVTLSLGLDSTQPYKIGRQVSGLVSKVKGVGRWRSILATNGTKDESHLIVLVPKIAAKEVLEEIKKISHVVDVAGCEKHSPWECSGTSG